MFRFTAKYLKAKTKFSLNVMVRKQAAVNSPVKLLVRTLTIPIGTVLYMYVVNDKLVAMLRCLCTYEQKS